MRRATIRQVKALNLSEFVNYWKVLTPIETPSTATTKSRQDPPANSAKDPDDLPMPSGLLVALVLLLLGGVSWLACCLWAICKRLKTGSTDSSTGEEIRAGSNNLPHVSSKQSRERNKRAHPGSVSEEGPDYENTRSQTSSVYDAMYEN